MGFVCISQLCRLSPSRRGGQQYRGLQSIRKLEGRRWVSPKWWVSRTAVSMSSEHGRWLQGFRVMGLVHLLGWSQPCQDTTYGHASCALAAGVRTLFLHLPPSIAWIPKGSSPRRVAAQGQSNPTRSPCFLHPPATTSGTQVSQFHSGLQTGCIFPPYSL